MQCLDNIEAAQRQNKLFAALKQGNEAMKQLQKEVTLEDVESLMSDSAESKEYQVRCGLAALEIPAHLCGPAGVCNLSLSL